MSLNSSTTGVPDDRIYDLVRNLCIPEEREAALKELSKLRENVPDLACILWYSFGAMTALLEEIVSIYPALSPSSPISNSSDRTCNALALLQCVASHEVTRPFLLEAQIPLYLYPFLSIQSQEKPFEFLRLTSLGVIGALVKIDDPEVVRFLLISDVLTPCLGILREGSELSRTVATFILQKILKDRGGLQHVCQTREQFLSVATALASMVQRDAPRPSLRLLKHIIRCYCYLAENENARKSLQEQLPTTLRDGTFHEIVGGDEMILESLRSLNAATQDT